MNFFAIFSVVIFVFWAVVTAHYLRQTKSDTERKMSLAEATEIGFRAAFHDHTEYDYDDEEVTERWEWTVEKRLEDGDT